MLVLRPDDNFSFVDVFSTHGLCSLYVCDVRLAITYPLLPQSNDTKCNTRYILCSVEILKRKFLPRLTQKFNFMFLPINDNLKHKLIFRWFAHFRKSTLSKPHKNIA